MDVMYLSGKNNMLCLSEKKELEFSPESLLEMIPASASA